MMSASPANTGAAENIKINMSSAILNLFLNIIYNLLKIMCNITSYFCIVEPDFYIKHFLFPIVNETYEIIHKSF
jgi:hypothetical protein